VSHRAMTAILTLGNGDYDQLLCTEVPIPEIQPGEVLVNVLAAGVNNTEINTRLGWYSSTVLGSTNETSAAEPAGAKADGGWNKQTGFPLIQGTDCCGVVVTVGRDAEPSLMDQRVLIRPCTRDQGFDSLDNSWMGSDFNGAFARYVP